MTMLKPFLKWAGGKFRVFGKIKDKFPLNANRYIEPFLGAGAVALNVDYPSYIVNDINKDLISVWKNLQKNKKEFINECEKLFIQENNIRENFDKLRKEFNESEDDLRKSYLFIYLNRHCFNGLCRYNSKGIFNVPFGKYDKPYFPKYELEQCLDKINNFKFYNKDFRKIFDLVIEDDLIYCDPPYLPISQSSNFTSYSTSGFNFDDQRDLAECAYVASKKGATVIISNHYTQHAIDLYKKDYNAEIIKFEVSRTISSKTTNRIPIQEIIAIFNRK